VPVNNWTGKVWKSKKSLVQKLAKQKCSLHFHLCNVTLGSVAPKNRLCGGAMG
jgi:hypothetical protein